MLGHGVPAHLRITSPKGDRTMRHAYVVAALLAVVLSASLATGAMAALVAGGGTTSTGTGGGMAVVSPDLVITQIAITSRGNGEFPTGTIRATVKNIGTAKSGPCTLGVIWTMDLTANPLGRLVTAAVPALAVGASTAIDMNFQSVSIPWKGMFIAAVDVPTAGHPKGSVTEVGHETNNGFAFVFDLTSGALPMTFTNPGAK
jgi:subtilase family serine protease